MENKEKVFEMVKELREDCARKQKLGLHFIMASVIIWCAVAIIHATNLPIVTKNFFTLCCSAPLMPMAFGISKLIKVDFQNKDNPLTNLGIIFAVNQIVYILIAMWVFSATPEKMVMVYAMITGAHFMPYGWLYQSKAYFVLSVVIPIVMLALGLRFPAAVVAGGMVCMEIVLCGWLIHESKKRG